MILSRTAENKIKIKTDEEGGGLRAVNCACCATGCNCPNYIDKFPNLKTILGNWTNVVVNWTWPAWKSEIPNTDPVEYYELPAKSQSASLAKYTSCLDPTDPLGPPLPFDFCHFVPFGDPILGIASPSNICAQIWSNYLSSGGGFSLGCGGNIIVSINGVPFPAFWGGPDSNNLIKDNATASFIFS
jgi:hypothetical protein